MHADMRFPPPPPWGCVHCPYGARLTRRGPTQRHAGLILGAEVIGTAPLDCRTRALRVLAGRVALAARIDAFADTRGGGRDGRQGLDWRHELEVKIAKWQEPPPAKAKKALKAPDDRPRRKRGGRRYRKMKEKLGMTEMRKDANRQSFNTATGEYGDDVMGLTVGMLGQEGSGRLRITKKDNRAGAGGAKGGPASKRPRTGAGGTMTSQLTSSGLSSVFAMTPVMGLELVNPAAQAARLREANAKYFSASGTYSFVKRD